MAATGGSVYPDTEHAEGPHAAEPVTHAHHGGHASRKDDVHRYFRSPIRWMTIAETAAYLLVAVALLAMAMIVLYRGVDDLYHIVQILHGNKGNEGFATNIIDALSEFLFVVILMELLATVITHIRHENFEIRPFLIIGIISGVRQILLVGAHLSLSTTITSTEWRQAQIELGVNAGIDLALVVCLVLIRRFQVERGAD